MAAREAVGREAAVRVAALWEAASWVVAVRVAAVREVDCQLIISPFLLHDKSYKILRKVRICTVALEISKEGCLGWLLWLLLLWRELLLCWFIFE